MLTQTKIQEHSRDDLGMEVGIEYDDERPVRVYAKDQEGRDLTLRNRTNFQEERMPAQQRADAQKSGGPADAGPLFFLRRNSLQEPIQLSWNHTAVIEEHHKVPTTSPTRAAIYIKEAAGYPDGENSKELQTEECEQFCLAQEFKITTRYYDPPGSRHQFDWMMGVSGRAGVKPGWRST